MVPGFRIESDKSKCSAKSINDGHAIHRLYAAN